jgi:hypothetical protein
VNSKLINLSSVSVPLQELQFQEQQEELQRELRQRSTQQLLEQTYYDNSNSKGVDLDYCRRAYDKPQLITNVNNLNYQASSNCNYNTINQTSAKDILYELKQYEHFANNSNHQLNHINFNNYVADRQTTSRQNGTNYSQNILNYNNSYYKINNINNYNYVKNQSSSSPSSQHQFQQQLDRDSYYSGKQQDKYLLNDKMERDETVECSQLVGNQRDTNGRNVTIHNFNGNNVASHTTIPPSHNNIDDEEEHHNANPSVHRSQHFTQVSC